MAVTFVPSRRDALLGQAQQQIQGGFQQLATNEENARKKALQGFQLSEALRGQGYNITPEQATAISDAASGGDVSALSSVFGQVREGGLRPEIQAGRNFQTKQRGFKLEEAELKARKAQQELDNANKPFFNTLEGKKYAAKESFKAGLKRKEKTATPAERLAGLNAESKNKVGSLASGLSALSGMRNAIASGITPSYINPNTPLVGELISDDDFTMNERVLAEVVGRLQSGGAINEEEGKRFIAMGPRPGDSAEVRQKKLASQEEFLVNKLRAFGFTPNDLAEAGLKIAQPAQQPIQQQVQTQQAAPVDAAAHPQAQEALIWARQNPNDPRSQQIMMKLGGGQ